MGCHHSSEDKGDGKRWRKSPSQRPMLNERRDNYSEIPVPREKPRPAALELDSMSTGTFSPSRDLSPSSQSPSTEFRWKPRPPPPAPDCSKQELQEYLATYSILPVNFVETPEVHDSPPLSPFSPKKHHIPGRRASMCDVAFDENLQADYTVKVVPKSGEETRSLVAVLRKLPIFTHLDDKELHTVVEAMDKSVHEKGDVIFKEGDLGADDDKMYVIIEGVITISTRTGEKTTRSDGDCFGEQELLFLQQRMHTCRVESQILRAWTLSRKDYRHLLRGASMRKREAYSNVLRKIPFLQPLTNAELIQLADCLQPVKYGQGEFMIQYGDIGLWMYIILEGKVEVLGRKEDGASIHVCYFSEGDHVGELEFINKHLTVADVVAVQDVRAARVHRDHFETCMGPIVDLLSREAVVSAKYEYYRSKTPGLRVSFKL